ncbi:hypothetical protein E2C01_087842 [Portunus trituberculatus]|uniref:Uncharacterized protein n=1 Tax=Portunus trituberculatus TaxID=210409 RepID=A0A5B7JF55_PORTR|nr:hypothetical protein [Portunus trituberculatus]
MDSRHQRRPSRQRHTLHGPLYLLTDVRLNNAIPMLPPAHHGRRLSRRHSPLRLILLNAVLS